MRKVLSLLLVSVLTLSLCACGDTTSSVVNVNKDSIHTISPDTSVSEEIIIEKNDSEAETKDESEVNDEKVGGGGFYMGNPWTDCQTIEEAESIVGFSFNSIKSIDVDSVSVMLADYMNIIQVHFYDNDNKITVRKSHAIGDVSGDYRTFENVIKEPREDSEMIYSGNGETFGLVTWVRDNFSYSISFENEVSKEILDYYVNMIFNDETVINQVVLYKEVSSSDNVENGDIIAQYTIPVTVNVIGVDEN